MHINSVLCVLILHYYSTKHWDCPNCMSDILPFTLLEQEEFLMLLLDMNVRPVYLNKDNFQRIYTDLHRGGGGGGGGAGTFLMEHMLTFRNF